MVAALRPAARASLHIRAMPSMARVNMKSGYAEMHFRVSTGELVRTEEEIKEQKPPATSSRGFKKIFGR
ncbi:MAG TPA: hypothetical protein VIS09_24840 [Streptomyces sp.]